MELNYDPGSFKDNEGRVFFHDERVFRTLNTDASARMQVLFKKGLISEMVDKGWLIPSSVSDAKTCGIETSNSSAFLEHARVPVIT